jgi:hypothetical protein
MIQLIPAQTAAYRVLRYALNAGDLLLLRSVSGRGRTTVLKKLHEETGGASKVLVDDIHSRCRKLFTTAWPRRCATTKMFMWMTRI